MAIRHSSLLCAPLVALLLGGCPVPITPVRRSPQPPQAKIVTGTSPIIPPLAKAPTVKGIFFTTPYLQLGANGEDSQTLAVVWHALDKKLPAGEKWVVKTSSPSGVGEWKPQTSPMETNRVAVGGVAPHVVFCAPLTGLTPGQPFDYRVEKNGKTVFTARANRSRPGPDQDYRIALFGDCAEDTAWQKKIAFETHAVKPDAVVITGDIVYPHGRASEYRANYFPVYAAEKADPKRGAPLLSSTLSIGVSGNHDLAYSNLARYPDGLAYYYYWKQPRNGWGGDSRGERPAVTGRKSAFMQAAGMSFPSGANFSFDYGNSHFVAIDANYYMNWQSPKMTDGLRKAILANPAARWRFVVLHVPPFHSSVSHQKEQWMRRLAPVFEETGVDVVWSGHVHNYQRSFPLRFKPSESESTDGTVDGNFSIDTDFDGVSVTKPNGVLYVVTGAGGAALYKKTVNASPDTQPFTAKYSAEIHSFTELTVKGETLSVRQLDENGKELDRWKVTK